MALYGHEDRVGLTTTTTGTGTFTTGSAISSEWRLPTAAGPLDGVEAVWLIKHQSPLSGPEVEVVTGVWTTGQITRATVLFSTNGNNPVFFSAGVKHVFCTVAGEQLNGIGPVASTDITGDLTLTDAHDRRTAGMLEVNAATSPVLTIPALSDGREFLIRRPINEPTPRLLLPTAGNVMLEGPGMGMAVLAPGDVGSIRYGASGQPMGDARWRLDARTTAGNDRMDLRRGRGITGDPVSAWASVEAGTDTYSQATAINRPAVNADGSIKLVGDAVSDEQFLVNPSRTAFAAGLFLIGVACRPVSITTFVRYLNLEVSGKRVQVQSSSLTRIQLLVDDGGANETVGANFASGQWQAMVFAVDRANSRVTWMSNSQSAADADRHGNAAVTAIPDVSLWNLGATGNALGSTSSLDNGEADFVAMSFIDGCDEILIGVEPDRGVMAQMLGEMIAELPTE